MLGFVASPQPTAHTLTHKYRHTRRDAGIQCQGWQAQYVPVAWILVIPAGMTDLCIRVCLQPSCWGSLPHPNLRKPNVRGQFLLGFMATAAGGHGAVVLAAFLGEMPQLHWHCG